jgi:choice-of-anchor A domain-containing protein
MKTRNLLEAGAAALALTALAASSHAASPAQEGLTYLSELNLIVLGSMSGGDDVEGKAFVGGTLTNGASFSIGTSNNPGQGYVDSGFANLTVYGNASGSLNIDNGKNGTNPGGSLSPGLTVGGNLNNLGGLPTNYTLKVGGTIATAVNPNAGDTIISGGPRPPGSNINGGSATFNVPNYKTTLQGQLAAQTAQFTVDLKDLSQALQKLSPTLGDGIVSSANALTVSATKGSGYIVIDTTAAALEAAGGKLLTFELKTLAAGGHVPVIINVSGGGAITISTDLGSETAGPYVLWNFENATSLSLPNGFAGSILAPDAAFSNGNQVNGSVAVASFDQDGEVHLGTFVGSPALTNALSGVPEPGIWTMMIAGVGFLGTTLRRRRTAVVA